MGTGVAQKGDRSCPTEAPAGRGLDETSEFEPRILAYGTQKRGDDCESNRRRANRTQGAVRELLGDIFVALSCWTMTKRLPVCVDGRRRLPPCRTRPEGTSVSRCSPTEAASARSEDVITYG